MIRIDYSTIEGPMPKLISAKYLADFAICILFNEGTERRIDFNPFLTKSIPPAIKKDLNENYFTHFTITDGNLNWNDYDMIFPIWDLYFGKLNANQLYLNQTNDNIKITNYDT